MSYMKKLYAFLDELTANNNREWFAAHKSEYQQLRTLWLADIQRVINVMAADDRAFAHLEAKDCAYRIYRDTRFSADKTPLKTYFSALISPSGRHTDRAAYYIQTGAAANEIAAGLWMPEGAVLKKVRKAIVDNIDEFREIVESPAMRRMFPGWEGRRLVTAPKGYDRNHPCIEYLRLVDIGKGTNPPRSFFEDSAWPARVAEMFEVLRPLCDFLNYSIDEEL